MLRPYLGSEINQEHLPELPSLVRIPTEVDVNGKRSKEPEVQICFLRLKSLGGFLERKRERDILLVVVVARFRWFPRAKRFGWFQSP